MPRPAAGPGLSFGPAHYFATENQFRLKASSVLKSTYLERNNERESLKMEDLVKCFQETGGRKFAPALPVSGIF